VVETERAVYVFEFKLDGSADEALEQIDGKGYLIPYLGRKGADGKPKALYKVGVSFDAATRTLGGWKVRES
ncbi:MAG: PD-(D/E)XK nuclease domain-containing protein, partial [Treponema sp.]|nr:PD-(D/E)XK nuclease domain-containing protein [Treponema sp.]